MSEHRCEFGLVVHDRDEPARHIDVAPGDGEGVDDRGIQERHRAFAAGFRDSRLDGHFLADPRHHRRPRTCVGTAEFGEDFWMHLGGLLPLALADLVRIGRVEGPAGRARCERADTEDYDIADIAQAASHGKHLHL